MGSENGIASRLARAALIKAGLTENEADSLFALMKAEHEVGRFSTVENRLRAIEDWAKAQPRTRTTLILNIIVSIGVAELTGPFNHLLVTGYDDVFRAAEALVAKVNVDNQTTLDAEDQDSLIWLKTCQSDRSSFEKAYLPNALLAGAFDHFGYYNHGEFLHRKAVERTYSLMGHDHMILGTIRLGLVTNLHKQKKYREAERECAAAINHVRKGSDFGQDYDYLQRIDVFNSLFKNMPQRYVCAVLKATIDRIALLKPPSDAAIIKGWAMVAEHCQLYG